MNWLTINLFKKLGWAKQIRVFDTEKQAVELKRAA
jgi:fatty-acid desaturase